MVPPDRKLRLEVRAVDSLKPLPRNARIHSEGQVEKIAKSVGQFGYVSPILATPEGVDGYLRSFGTDGEDDVPAPPKKPVSRNGDLWALGSHRLLCGDATKADDVARLLSDSASLSPVLMVTDPPYGVNYDPDWRNRSDRKSGKPYGARAVGRAENDDRVDWTAAWKLFQGNVAYVWHATLSACQVAESLEAVGFELKSQIVWAKNRLVISRCHYHWQHEGCWYAIRKGATGNWQGDRKQTTLWSIAHAKSETGHSNQKPVEAMRRPILNNSKPGEIVYEPFAGSGTTIVAAETSERICSAIEISPAYVDVAVERWETLTGGKAKRASR